VADDDVLSPYIQRLFQIESGGNPNAVTGKNRGLGQFGPREEAQYGITDANRTDPMVQAAAVAAEHAKNNNALASVLGRDPTFADHYLAHQQGLAGAKALFSNPDQPAWQAIRPFYKSDAIAQRAIMGNIPAGNSMRSRDPNDITAADFTGMWRDKFNRGLPGSAVAAAQPSVGGNMGSAPPAAAPAVGAPAAGAVASMAAAPLAGAAAGTAPAGEGTPAGALDKLIATLKGATDEDKPSQATQLSKQLLAQAGQPTKSPFPFPVAPLQPGMTQGLHPLPLNPPRFMAEGGVVTEPTLAVVGERGPEAVVPLDRDSMTHYPPAPNPAAPAVDMGRQIASSLYNRFIGNPMAAAKSVTEQAMSGRRVSDDPEAIRNAWRAASGLAFTGGLPGGIFAAARGGVPSTQLNAVLGPLAFEDSMFHKLIDKTTKKEVGYANLSMTPDKDIYVNMVDSPGGAGDLGLRGTRELLKSVQEHYPEARGIGGFRMSGARQEAGDIGNAYYSFANKRFERAPWEKPSEKEENLMHALESLRGTQWEQGVRDELDRLRRR